MRSKDGKYIETESMESYHVNLEKVQEIYYNKDRKMSRFERELMMLTINEKRLLEKVSKGDRVMEEAREKITNLTEDGEFIGLYDEELEKEREYKDRMAYAEKIGLEKGIEQGIEEGILEAKMETARKMKSKDTDVTFIAEVTGLSIEEIKDLK